MTTTTHTFEPGDKVRLLRKGHRGTVIATPAGKRADRVYVGCRSLEGRFLGFFECEPTALELLEVAR